MRIKNKKKLMILIITICVVALALGIGFLVAKKNPRVRMLLSVVHFTDATLKDSGYLLYDIDIMEFLHEYVNADIHVEGKAGFSHMQTVHSSIFMDVDATRSFEQKRMAGHMDLDFVFLNAGKLNVYAENDTIYLDVPLLGDNVGYAFPTGDTLFRKAPDLTSDINQKWFRENRMNIIRLMRNIDMQRTGKTIEDDGGVSEEFVVTIPEGQGGFIWELLGMEAPDYDVVLSIYLTKDNHMRRMEMDLSHVLKGATLVIDGESAGTLMFRRELPQNETVEMTMVRNANHKNWIDCTLTYTTSKKEILTATSNITWKDLDKGFELKVNDLTITKDEKVLGEGFFKGSMVHLDEKPDVFGGREEYLYGLPALDWREIRDNSAEFVKDVLSHTALADLKD